MSAILSSPCWVKASDLANPAFAEAYNLFVDQRDQFGGALMRHMLHIHADDFHVAVVGPEELNVASPTTTQAPSSTNTAAEKPAGFPYMVAVPFTVCPAVCDDLASRPDASTASKDGPLCMSAGAVTALVDMVTSFHIILANLPATNGHVSLSIQSNSMTPMQCGQTYLAISRIDKMGRRIVYSAVEFVEPTLQPAHDDAAPLPMATTAELLTAMKSATVMANVKHVKSMLSFGF